MGMVKKITILLTAMALLFMATACEGKAADTQPATDNLFAMDTYMTFTVYGENANEALEKAKEKIILLDDMLSVNNEDSDVYKLNNSAHAVLSEETLYLLKRSMEAYDISSGAFNPLVYPLMLAWGFTSEQYQVQFDEYLLSLMPLLDMEAVDIDETTGNVSFEKEGMMIDFGGIAKGYTSSCLMDIYRDYGVESACVSLGGNVHVLGCKPDGSKWRVAVRDPEDSSSYMGILSISDSAVITSGAYERYFEQDGEVYHHILDPETGHPADSGIISSTIVTNDGTLADALSTAVYVMGLDAAVNMWREHSNDLQMIIMTEDHNIYITKGLEESFTSSRYNVITVE